MPEVDVTLEKLVSHCLFSHLQNGDNRIYLVRLLRRLNELISVKCLKH